MKKRSFFAGMLTMALIVGLGVSALAATGQVSFNASALTLNGTQVSAKGENYTLANGQSVPSSITYTDEKGGGTTYLPVRRISELLGVETGWDGAAGAVTIKGEAAATPSQPPVTTTPPTNYSDWSKEDEAAYQEFKGLWEVSLRDSGDKIHAGGGVTLDKPWQSYILLYNGLAPKSEVPKIIADAVSLGYAQRLAFECRTKNVQVSLWYCTDPSATSMNTGLIFVGAYE